MAVKVRDPVFDIVCIVIIVVVLIIIAAGIVDNILREREEKCATYGTNKESKGSITRKPYCDYCGFVLTVHDSQCPRCGAANKNYQCAENHDRNFSG